MARLLSTLIEHRLSHGQVFSKDLDKIPLHISTLVQLELIFRASIQIVFYEIQLLGRTECLKDSTEDAKMLRFLTPIAKAYVCKIGVNACSEAMEALGGQVRRKQDHTTSSCALSFITTLRVIWKRSVLAVS